jgi:hypothetical protein
MEATVFFDSGMFDGLAVIKDWHWTSIDNKNLEEMLNLQLPDGGPSPSQPQPEIEEAHRMAKMFDGEVIDEKKYPPDKDTEGRIY